MAHALDKQIQDYLPLLGSEEKKSLISVIRSFLSLKKEHENIDIEEYNKELDEAEAEYKNGDYVTHEDMKKQIKQWQKGH